MRFIIDDSIWELFPELHIGVVVAQGFRNDLTAWPEIAERLQRATLQAKSDPALADVSLHPAIIPWREAYASFGMKPNQFRSSIESLLRAAQAERLRSISPLVDLYNAVSLKYRLPCGGEDLAAMAGDLHLTRALGDEAFVALGSTENAPPQPGEVIYRDAVGVICRSFNWREAERTKLLPTTTHAVLFIEGLHFEDGYAVQKACLDLALSVEQRLGGQTQLIVLNATQTDVDLERL
jgi:DNA/RNA-binding domain of Phe-tRNA-synthetase-like protein